MVPVPIATTDREMEDGHSSDPWSTSLSKPVMLSDHSRHVEEAVKTILNELSGWAIGQSIREALELAALYHDAGKAHPAFQRMMMDLPEGRRTAPGPAAVGEKQRQPEKRAQALPPTSLAVPWPSWNTGAGWTTGPGI